MMHCRNLISISKTAKFLARRQIPISARWNSIDVGQKVPDESTKELLDILGGAGSQSAPPAPNPVKEKLAEIFGTGQKSHDPLPPDHLSEDYIELGDAVKSTDFQPIAELGQNEAVLNFSYWFQKWIEFSHENLGISVGMTVFGSALLLKLISAPLYLKLERYFTQTHNFKIEGSTLQRHLRAAVSNKDNKAKKEAYSEWKDFCERQNVPNNWTVFQLSALNALILGTQVYAVHKMARTNMLDMMSQKFAWIAHLGAPDPTYVLPLVSSICFFSYSVDLFLRGYEIKIGHDKLFHYGAVLMCGGFSAILYSTLVNQPAVTTLCLATNLAIARFYVNLFKVPQVRKILGLPDLVSHSRTHIQVVQGQIMLPPDSTADYNKKVEKMEAALKRIETENLAVAKKSFRQRLTHKLLGINENLTDIRTALTDPGKTLELLNKLQANNLQAKSELTQKLTNQNPLKVNQVKETANQNQENANFAKETTNQNRANVNLAKEATNQVHATASDSANQNEAEILKKVNK